MRFTKMQGIGNDFVVVDGFAYTNIPDPGGLSQRICDRHFGVGADGLIWMVPSDCADARMRIFNSDGSEPEMCGNGLRCAALFLKEKDLCTKDEMTIETLAGVLRVQLQGSLITADMGEPCLEAAKIPVAADTNRVTIDVDGRAVEFFCVSMGNPHAVTFDLYPENADFYRLGAMLEKHPLFPAKANIEFCRVEADGVRVRVWERGDGETLACGTGACAVLTAAASLGLSPRKQNIHLPGGTLTIHWQEDNHLAMQGPAVTVFEGDFPA